MAAINRERKFGVHSGQRRSSRLLHISRTFRTAGLYRRPAPRSPSPSRLRHVDHRSSVHCSYGDTIGAAPRSRARPALPCSHPALHRPAARADDSRGCTSPGGHARPRCSRLSGCGAQLRTGNDPRSQLAAHHELRGNGAQSQPPGPGDECLRARNRESSSTATKLREDAGAPWQPRWGRLDDAIRCLRDALELWLEQHTRAGESNVLLCLGRTMWRFNTIAALKSRLSIMMKRFRSRKQPHDRD